MKPENELALIVAFYISKYDREGINNLGYSTFNEAYRDIERKFGVKATSLKNRRDEFDPIHDNERVGWYQRPMSPSRVRIVEQFSAISEPTLRGIVKDIISGEWNTSKTILERIREATKVSKDGKSVRQGKYIVRGPTGKKAEELFVRYFNEGKTPFKGVLEDCRDFGAGHDFKVTMETSETFIEVKGLDGYTGGVLFTDKEWRTAEQKGTAYCLVVISGIAGSPQLECFFNPFQRFSPRRSIATNITVSWSVSANQISQAEVASKE